MQSPFSSGRVVCVILGVIAAHGLQVRAGDQHRAELIFPLHPEHHHAPGIAELPNGDLFVPWYRGAGEKSADDVAVRGSRRAAGKTTWSDPFLIADPPGFPDCSDRLSRMARA